MIDAFLALHASDNEGGLESDRGDSLSIDNDSGRGSPRFLTFLDFFFLPAFPSSAPLRFPYFFAGDGFGDAACQRAG